MITPDLARRVVARTTATGRAWEPASGDRFLVPDRGLDDQVFVVAEMTIEVAEHPTGTLIRFNGTTEWALDTVEADEVVWLPWEHQLRAALGDRFERLERIPGPPEGFVVVTTDGSRHADVDVECAYARALLGA